MSILIDVKKYISRILECEGSRIDIACVLRDVVLDFVIPIKKENAKLREALEWMVEHDETNDTPENAYFMDGYNRAVAVLRGEDDEKDLQQRTCK